MVVSAIVALLVGRVPVSYAWIYLDGELTETVNLFVVAERSEIDVVGSDGFNVIEVERGRIRVADADCPGRVCVRQGWVSSGLVPIVCLPNRMVVVLEDRAVFIIEGGGEKGVDAVVG